VTAGYAEVNSQDKLGSNFSGNFQVPFAGFYGKYANGNFYADALARWDFYQMSLRAPDAGLADQRLDAKGFSISASAAYQVPLGNSWFIEPSASVIHSTVNVDTLNATQGAGSALLLPQLGYSVQFGTIESTLGRLGARIGTSFNTGNLAWQPFAAASVWHEFEGNTTSQYALSPSYNTVLQIFPASSFTSSGTITGSRIGTYGQYSLGILGGMVDTPWLGYMRVDYKQGANIEAWGFNAGLRYQFEANPTPAARPAGPYKAPSRVASPYDWSGFYIGGLAGGAFGHTTWNSPSGVSASPDIAGALGGATVGYNHQVGPWVWGVEGDFSGTTARGGQICSDPNSLLLSQNCNGNAHFLATADARLGYAWDRVMPYFKAGGAWTRNNFDILCNGSLIFASAFCSNSQGFTVTDSRLGWTVGAGIELGLTPNWSAKVEYDYLDFGSRSYAVPGGVPFSGGITENFSVKENFSAVKVGVNYRFGPSDPALAATATELSLKARPSAQYNWTGGYAGVAVGDRQSDTSWNTNEIFALPGQFDNTTSPASFFSSTVRAGGYLGYNWQFAPRWVGGVEGDIAWGHSSMSLNGIPGTFGNSGITFAVPGPIPSIGCVTATCAVTSGLEAELSDNASVKLGWDGSLRGRLGFLALPNVLLYGTGGVSFQEVDVGASCLGTAAVSAGGAVPTYCLKGEHSESFSRLLVGYTIGGGVEAALKDNWLGRLEGRYANYGRFGHTFFAGTGDDVGADFHLSTWTFLAGLAYKFDGGNPFTFR